MRGMASIPESTKSSLWQKLDARARERWPGIAEVQLRFRGPFAYLDARVMIGDGSGAEVWKLARLRYSGSASLWGFAIYRGSHDDYQDSWLPSGLPVGSPEEVLDTAAGLYFGDPTGWV